MHTKNYLPAAQEDCPVECFVVMESLRLYHVIYKLTIVVLCAQAFATGQRTGQCLRENVKLLA